MSYWSGKRVTVTGGAGFIGSHLVEMLVQAGSRVTVPVTNLKQPNSFLDSVRSAIHVIEADLMDYHQALQATKDQDVVMNLAARVGGIEYNIKNPASIFRENAQLFMNVLEASRVNTVGRFLVTSSACVYPRFCTIPTPETEGFLDMPEPTNDGYGFAKRVEEFLGQKYSQQYGMSIAIARPYNAYGPRDNFDPATSHVIPALIKKVLDTQEGGEVEVWGDGRQSRAFLYVEDFARGLMEVTEKYAEADALNIGTDEETHIGDLIRLLIELTGKNVGIRFDTTKPQGQPRRNCDNTKAMEKLGFQAKVSLRDGLTKTLAWYNEAITHPSINK